MVMTTDNIWLLNSAPHLPVIMCEQRSAKKKPVEWSDFVEANIAAAGDDIGAITNRCTAMYDKFTMTDDPELKKVLEYRIQCSQHFQQNAID